MHPSLAMRLNARRVVVQQCPGGAVPGQSSFSNCGAGTGRSSDLCAAEQNTPRALLFSWILNVVWKLSQELLQAGQSKTTRRARAQQMLYRVLQTTPFARCRERLT